MWGPGINDPPGKRAKRDPCSVRSAGRCLGERATGPSLASGPVRQHRQCVRPARVPHRTRPAVQEPFLPAAVPQRHQHPIGVATLTDQEPALQTRPGRLQPETHPASFTGLGGSYRRRRFAARARRRTNAAATTPSGTHSVCRNFPSADDTIHDRLARIRSPTTHRSPAAHRCVNFATHSRRPSGRHRAAIGLDFFTKPPPLASPSLNTEGHPRNAETQIGMTN
jgi:hypothetical protein